MLKPSRPADRGGIHPLAIALSLVCLLLWTGHGYAARFKPRGVTIPDASDMFVQGATRLDRIDTGADLAVPLDSGEAWQLLNRVLASLGIKPKEQDTQRQHLLTGWILWVWDPDLEIGRGKPPLKAFSRTYERHRFEFSVSPGADNAGALIRISDAARQMEIDITPDSGYSWFEWQDAPAQADAAWSFMRRLQGNFESALSSRLMPSTVAPPRIIEPVRLPETTRETKPVTQLVPTPAAAPTAVPAPVPPLKSGNKAVDKTELPVIEPGQAGAGKPASPAGKPSLPRPGVEPQTVKQTPARSEKSRNAALPPPASPGIQPVYRSRAVQGGLLVDGGLDATWQALLAAIDAQGIQLQSIDQPQHMLTTQWTNARYDQKNQRFALESKVEERWAFNVWGKGQQRHRFQLILIPVESGARTMVYAYHTGFQVETDETPDSSQTLLYWKDKKTDPAIAMAFLRQLRLMVRQ